MLIKNYSGLAVSPLRKAALSIAEAGLLAIDTGKAIRRSVRLKNNFLFLVDEKINLNKISKVFVVAVGKCAYDSAKTLEDILGGKIHKGIALGINMRGRKLNKIEVFEGNHPLPSKKNAEITKKIIELLSGLKKDDLVIFAVSGGGSTLLCQASGLTHKDEAEIFSHLTRVGADIKKLNIVRKHLSLARGGQLAKVAYPAKVVSLLFSDIIGNDPGFIASGPMVPDKTTINDARRVIREYGVEKHCGKISRGLIETPKDKKYFKNVKNFIIVSNKIALEAMHDAAKKIKLPVKIVSNSLSGEAAKRGNEIAQKLHSAKGVLLYGGETTVRIRGNGKGGRNMELALSALRFLKDDELVLTLASDGRDNSDFAGAICDKTTKEKALKLRLSVEKYLKENNSYEFFKKTKDNLITGETGSNVADLIIGIKK